VSRAEALALALLSVLVTGVVLPYVTDLLGLGIAPFVTMLAAAMVATAIVLRIRHCRPGWADTTVFAATTLVTLAVCGWMAWPALLPPGSGPDLTHHLLLVDYVERHGTLVHDPNAAAAIGEMAHYTPGLHLLAAIAGLVSRSSGFVAAYPVVAVSVALKFGVFTLCVLRLLADAPARFPLAILSVGFLFYASAYTLGSFINDSFLAQAVAELFALAMWWTLLVWEQRPSTWTMAVFGVCGVATFLTWPVWVGPPVAALAILIGLRRDLDWRRLAAHLMTAAAPIAAVAAVHSVGRTATVSLVGTSGAVSLPAMSVIGWWLPGLAAAGLIAATKAPPFRALVVFLVALGMQATALWLVARRSGASTPYMAIKMLYLAVYPLTAAATLAIARALTKPRWAALAAVAMLAISGRHIAVMKKPVPIVARDLWSAGLWARAHAPAACVDYLVGNEYTAYWLHLAVLGNPRSAARSTNNDTYSTSASFARWLTDDIGAPYAVAKWSLLPADIRDRVKVLHRVGDAAVIARSTSCTVQGS
jgi:hypothetical protein